MLESKA